MVGGALEVDAKEMAGSLGTLWGREKCSPELLVSHFWVALKVNGSESFDQKMYLTNGEIDRKMFL